MAHHYTGRGVPHQVLAKAIELEECAADRPPVTWRARSNLGLFLKWADDFEGARPILMAMCQDAADEGDESSLPDLLEQLAELELWAGDWKRAARYANECVEAAQWTGQAVVISLNRCVRGLVNAHLGLADQARSDAQAGLAFAEERADPWVAGWGWRVLGSSSCRWADLPTPARTCPGPTRSPNRLACGNRASGAFTPTTWRR